MRGWVASPAEGMGRPSRVCGGGQPQAASGCSPTRPLVKRKPPLPPPLVEAACATANQDGPFCDRAGAPVSRSAWRSSASSTSSCTMRRSAIRATLSASRSSCATAVSTELPSQISSSRARSRPLSSASLSMICRMSARASRRPATMYTIRRARSSVASSSVSVNGRPSPSASSSTTDSSAKTASASPPTSRAIASRTRFSVRSRTSSSCALRAHASWIGSADAAATAASSADSSRAAAAASHNALAWAARAASRTASARRVPLCSRMTRASTARLRSSSSVSCSRTRHSTCVLHGTVRSDAQETCQLGGRPRAFRCTSEETARGGQLSCGPPAKTARPLPTAPRHHRRTEPQPVAVAQRARHRDHQAARRLRPLERRRRRRRQRQLGDADALVPLDELLVAEAEREAALLDRRRLEDARVAQLLQAERRLEERPAWMGMGMVRDAQWRRVEPPHAFRGSSLMDGRTQCGVCGETPRAFRCSRLTPSDEGAAS